MEVKQVAALPKGFTVTEIEMREVEAHQKDGLRQGQLSLAAPAGSPRSVEQDGETFMEMSFLQAHTR